MLFDEVRMQDERSLKTELFSCMKHVGIPYRDLLIMPVKDRRFYIKQHNDYIERQDTGDENSLSKGTGNGAAINRAADQMLTHQSI